MIWRIIALVYSFIYTVGFLVWVIDRYGLKKSISDYFYTLLKEKKGWTFVMFILSLAIPMALASQTVIILVSSGLLSLVAVSPYFKDEDYKGDGLDNLEEKVHGIGAIGSIVVLLWACYSKFEMYVHPTIFLLFVIFATPTKFKKGINYYTLWIEIAAIYLGFSVIINQLIKTAKVLLNL